MLTDTQRLRRMERADEWRTPEQTGRLSRHGGGAWNWSGIDVCRTDEWAAVEVVGDEANGSHGSEEEREMYRLTVHPSAGDIRAGLACFGDTDTDLVETRSAAEEIRAQMRPRRVDIRQVSAETDDECYVRGW